MIVRDVVSTAVVIMLAARCPVTTGSVILYSSCKAIKNAVAGCTSDEYSIRTSTGRVLERVFCEMTLNGGGYTFLKPSDIPGLTNAELQAIFTDRSNYMLRTRLTDGTQQYGILRQLSQNSDVSLSVSTNCDDDDDASDDSDDDESPALATSRHGSSYLFYGFRSVNRNRHSNAAPGLQVNGRDVLFSNCHSRDSSYIAIFPQPDETPSADVDPPSPTYNDVFAALRLVPPASVMPDIYFTTAEFDFGGCGLHTGSGGPQTTQTRFKRQAATNNRHDYRTVRTTMGFLS